MSARAKATFYLIPRAALDDEPTSAVLDMLRYDGATVESNAPPGYYLFRSEAGGAPHVARWRSFGILVDPTHVFTDSGEAWEWFHGQRRKREEASRG